MVDEQYYYTHEQVNEIRPGNPSRKSVAEIRRGGLMGSIRNVCGRAGPRAVFDLGTRAKISAPRTITCDVDRRCRIVSHP